jgi:hypothetical protein
MTTSTLPSPATASDPGLAWAGLLRDVLAAQGEDDREEAGLLRLLADLDPAGEIRRHWKRVVATGPAWESKPASRTFCRLCNYRSPAWLPTLAAAC